MVIGTNGGNSIDGINIQWEKCGSKRDNPSMTKLMFINH